MVSLTLAAGSAMAMAAGAVFLEVARRIAARPVSGEGQLARSAFTFWALCLGLHSLISGGSSLLAAEGLITATAYAAATFVNVLLISLSLWGLTYYFVYLLTGRQNAWIPLAVFFALVYIMLVYFLAASDPGAIRVGRWRASLTFDETLPAWYYQLVVVLITVPQTLGALAYATLFVRLENPALRYRVALITASALTWAASMFLASTARFARIDAFQVGNRLMLLAAGVAIIAAYMPPRWLRQRFNLEQPTEEKAATTRS